MDDSDLRKASPGHGTDSFEVASKSISTQEKVTEQSFVIKSESDSLTSSSKLRDQINEKYGAQIEILKAKGNNPLVKKLLAKVQAEWNTALDGLGHK